MIGAARRRPFPPQIAGLVRGVLLAALAAGVSVPGKGDVFHLTSGGKVEGVIIEQTEGAYKIRTVVGTVTLSREAVSRIERKPSVLEEYVVRREQTGDTPAAQVQLAQWCQEQGLTAAWRTHLERAIQLDPNCEPARRALGFVRVNRIWVDGRPTTQAPGVAASKREDQDEQAANGDERVVAAIQQQWSLQIRAIRQTKLETSLPSAVADGRRRILQIRDPLAILPMARVLSEGNRACRDVLVEALARFTQDEATMNLAALALADPDDEIRRRALTELDRRNHPKVVPQFRRALATDNDELIRRAAVALGLLGAKSAVPDLIGLLTAQRRKMIEVPVRYYFYDYPIVFDTPTVCVLGTATRIYHRPVLGIASIWPGLVTVSTEYQLRDVTVFRTEVLEALKTLTGQNFGFDEQAWRDWYQRQQS